MFPSKSFLSLLLIAVSHGNSVLATPMLRNSKAVLEFTRHINITGFSNIADADRARAKALKSLPHGKPGGQTKRASPLLATNAGNIYTVNVGIGSPATQYTLIIDTGSSVTWVGAAKPYVQTSTSKSTGQSISITYGAGSFHGAEYTDTVTLLPEFVIKSQAIGAASTSSGVDIADGILGLGPVDLSSGTIVGSSAKIPTVTDNLAVQGAISTESIGVYFTPTSVSDTDGELSFGGVDSSKLTGDIGYVPITSTYPSSSYWGIDQTIGYGSTSIMGRTAGIVDTGTTNIMLPNSAYDNYVMATGAIYDSTTTLLTIPPSQYGALNNLDFNIGSHTYSLTPNGQIWPRSLNQAIGGNSDSIYLIIASTGTDFGEGLDFILGYTFLERFYSVFDVTNGRIGFATTAHTTSTSN